MDTMNAPSPNIMNKMQRCVLGMYSYDDNPEDLSLENLLHQSIVLIGGMPTMMVNAYQMKRRFYDKQSMFFHLPQPGHCTAEHILSTYRPDQKFTHEEAKLLDTCLLLHADHGGGNCSTFATRVVSSSGSDTYSAIAAGIGALRAPSTAAPTWRSTASSRTFWPTWTTTTMTTRCGSISAASCASRPATAAA